MNSNDLEEIKRYFGVVAEGLRHDIQQVAEGHETILSEVREFRETVQVEFKEVRSLIKFSYTEWEQRIVHLENDVLALKNRLERLEAYQWERGLGLFFILIDLKVNVDHFLFSIRWEVRGSS